MPPEQDEAHEKHLREVTRGLPFYLAEKLRNSIEQDRRWKAEKIARRLLGIPNGKSLCPSCNGHGSKDWCDTCLGEGVIDDN